MKVPVLWLNDYVQVDDIDINELSDKLVNIGFEVEEILYAGEGINNVTVGKILDIKKHPDANKLQVCMVDVGKEITTIVTGANNISVGDVVPVALDGATLPDGKEIHAAPLRGVMSYGMMCSGSELKIDDNVIAGAEVNGILILPKDFAVGADIKDVLSLNEYVLDIAVTANRPDCQSIYGIAREVGAVLGRKVKTPILKYKTVSSSTKMPQVEVEDFELCPRYTARLIEGVQIEQSPKWMRDRLRLAGINPINNVVDITNFVLIEIGQPLHAFDLRQIDEKISVRCAADGEKITALDKKEYSLNSSMLVIADKVKPLAIAGVMGGEFSGIVSDTSAVLLEAAKFARGNIRATSRALGLRSDSSARYERGVDWSSIDMGRERALALFYQLKVGKIADATAQCETKAPSVKVIKTSAAQISALLGIDIKAASIIKILRALGFNVMQQENKLTVEVPLYREDIENYTDLTEEVIRYYGYDNITSTFLEKAHPTVGGLNMRQHNMKSLKTFMCSCGLYEVATYSFINERLYDMLRIEKESSLRNFIRIRNPISVEYAVMRTQLIGSMLKIIYNNTSRKNNDLKFFEVSKTFMPESLPLNKLPHENETLCICLSGEKHDFYELKDIVAQVLSNHGVEYKIDYSKRPYMHPGVSAEIILPQGTIGYFGKIHPEVAENFSIPENTYVAEIELETFIDLPKINRQYVPLPKFPAVDRDLAFIVEDKYSVGELISEIKIAGGQKCESIRLFDIYKGAQIQEGYKSVAFSFKIVPSEKTLTDEEIQKTVNRIVDSLKTRFGAQLRLQ
ncbi:MAG: phenylalanine--tRNA ligase subunit beta [Clostridia bacterium]|nr:phenylalanine--tRNA ligase subunit beta [Clostridia bacterium]